MKANKRPKHFSMKRWGTFIPENMTSNQCGQEGIKDYEYTIVCVLEDKLDCNGFCIDHADLDKAISNAKIQGSCEEMQRIIYKAVTKTLKKKDIQLLAYKCTINPVGMEVKANITYIADSHPYYTMFLNV